ncbi:MAG: hypothetical protein GWP09_01070, partial [Nitrospiraceae bacterium]|nr:hypothetical protein [Nitrospiraceae bacterium]
EELTEAIIDERWTDLMKNIQKIVDWKNRSEERIAHLEKGFSDLEDDFKRLELAIVGRIKEYDQNLQETLGNVKALNMVFKQILPQFSLDIKNLHRIVSELKGESNASSNAGKKKVDKDSYDTAYKALEKSGLSDDSGEKSKSKDDGSSKDNDNNSSFDLNNLL